MKAYSKTLAFFLLLCGLITLPACDSLLQEEPKTFLSPANFYESEDDAVAAVNGVYQSLAEEGLYQRHFWTLGDLPTGNLKVRPSLEDPNRHNMEEYKLGPANNIVGGFWEDAYNGINRTNAAIAGIPNVPNLSDARKSQLIAEAKYVRALVYFDLVRVFGGVPLMLKPSESGDNFDVPRDPVDAVYEQIIADLTESEKNLLSEGETEDGRVSTFAATSLLAKVYLARGNFADAAAAAKNVIDNGPYRLLGSYSDLWKIDNQNNAESIFRVVFRTNSPANGGQAHMFTFPRGTPIPTYSNFWPTSGVLSAFSPEDERKEVTFVDTFTFEGVTYTPEDDWTYYGPSHKKGISKYTDLENGPNRALSWANGYMDFYVQRYADVKLIYAEAENEINGPGKALPHLNDVRTRAGLPSLSQGISQAALRDSILLERRREFVMEAQRWFDLKRTGRLVSTLKNDSNPKNDRVQEHNLLFPIPQAEMDANPNLEQNPGYGGG